MNLRRRSSVAWKRQGKEDSVNEVSNDMIKTALLKRYNKNNLQIFGIVSRREMQKQIDFLQV